MAPAELLDKDQPITKPYFKRRGFFSPSDAASADATWWRAGPSLRNPAQVMTKQMIFCHFKPRSFEVVWNNVAAEGNGLFSLTILRVIQKVLPHLMLAAVLGWLQSTAGSVENSPGLKGPATWILCLIWG